MTDWIEQRDGYCHASGWSVMQNGPVGVYWLPVNPQGKCLKRGKDSRSVVRFKTLEKAQAFVEERS